MAYLGIRCGIGAGGKRCVDTKANSIGFVPWRTVPPIIVPVIESTKTTNTNDSPIGQQTFIDFYRQSTYNVMKPNNNNNNKYNYK